MKAPAMLYGDTSTWNHMSDEPNGGLDKIQDLLLRQESGQGVVTSCFQYISHVSFLPLPHVVLRMLMSFCSDSVYESGGFSFMAGCLPWYKGVFFKKNGCKFGRCIICLLELDCME